MMRQEAGEEPVESSWRSLPLFLFRKVGEEELKSLRKSLRDREALAGS